jgi:hypothetical protein
MSSSGRSPAVPTRSGRSFSWISHRPYPAAAKSLALSWIASATSSSDMIPPSNRNRRTLGVIQWASNAA